MASAVEENVELDEETLSLQQELADIDDRILGEKKQIEMLSLENDEKTERLGEMEAYMEMLKGRNAADVSMLKDEQQCEKEKLMYEAQVLKGQLGQLQNKHKIYTVVLNEIQTMTADVETVMEDLSDHTMKHEEMKHNVMREMLDLRRKLEAAFRNTLREMDGNYTYIAFNALAEEAKGALLVNSKIRDELAMQSVGLQSLAIRQTLKRKESAQLARELNLLDLDKNAMAGEMSRLLKQKIGTEAGLQGVADAVKKLESEQAGLRLQLQRHGITAEAGDILQDIQAKRRMTAVVKQVGARWERRQDEVVTLLLSEMEKEKERQQETMHSLAAPGASQGLRRSSSPSGHTATSAKRLGRSVSLNSTLRGQKRQQKPLSSTSGVGSTPSDTFRRSKRHSGGGSAGRGLLHWRAPLAALVQKWQKEDAEEQAKQGTTADIDKATESLLRCARASTPSSETRPSRRTESGGGPQCDTPSSETDGGGSTLSSTGEYVSGLRAKARRARKRQQREEQQQKRLHKALSLPVLRQHKQQQRGGWGQDTYNDDKHDQDGQHHHHPSSHRPSPVVKALSSSSHSQHSRSSPMLLSGDSSQALRSHFVPSAMAIAVSAAAEATVGGMLSSSPHRHHADHAPFFSPAPAGGREATCHGACPTAHGTGPLKEKQSRRRSKGQNPASRRSRKQHR